MNTRIILVGAGGHGREVLSLLVDSGNRSKLMGFVDDNPALKDRQILGLPVIGDIASLLSTDKRNIKLIICVGDNATRRKLALKLKEMKFKFYTAISSSAYVSSFSEIGEGSVVFPGSVINGNAVIKDHVIINAGAVVSHDSFVEDFANINPGAHIAGNVRVGEGSFVGMGANVKQGITIGKWAFVGGGAMVIEHVKDFTTVVGIPARLKRTRPADWYKK